MQSNSLETLYMKETSGHCIFSTKIFGNLLFAGCFEGHLFVFDLDWFEKKEVKKLSQGIYDIITVNFKGEDYLLFGQHYGHLDMLRASDLKHVLTVNPNKVNTIFQMFQTSRTNEIALCAYNGLYFGRLESKGGKFDIAVSTQETYLTDRQCTRGLEYQPDKLIVCVNEDESFYLIDR